MLSNDVKQDTFWKVPTGYIKTIKKNYSQRTRIFFMECLFFDIPICSLSKHGKIYIPKATQ